MDTEKIITKMLEDSKVFDLYKTKRDKSIEETTEMIFYLIDMITDSDDIDEVKNITTMYINLCNKEKRIINSEDYFIQNNKSLITEYNIEDYF